ncbi:hypothetical protein [Amycolatopsis saalfeldensis]|uniref:hypothetical protein n=1 Tax=Amycolatopsis saalfeldensis TaxID=394193 RepID=UPI0015A72AF5|nr:hypothetical protein [Amycolatopsis saalfeldensis]
MTSRRGGSRAIGLPCLARAGCAGKTKGATYDSCVLALAPGTDYGDEAVTWQP